MKDGQHSKDRDQRRNQDGADEKEEDLDIGKTNKRETKQPWKSMGREAPIHKRRSYAKPNHQPNRDCARFGQTEACVFSRRLSPAAFGQELDFSGISSFWTPGGCTPPTETPDGCTPATEIHFVNVLFRRDIDPTFCRSNRRSPPSRLTSYFKSFSFVQRVQM